MNGAAYFPRVTAVKCKSAPGFVFAIPNFLRNLRTGLISYSVSHLKAFPAECFERVKLIGPIRKQRRKWSVVNMVPGPLRPATASNQNTWLGKSRTSLFETCDMIHAC